MRGFNSCLNTKGRASNAVPQEAHELPIPSRLSITIATDINAATTKPLANPRSDTHSHVCSCGMLVIVLRFFFVMLFLFFSKLRVYLNECRHGKGDDAEEHDQDEEGLVSHGILNPSRHHAREHQSKI